MTDRRTVPYSTHEAEIKRLKDDLTTAYMAGFHKRDDEVAALTARVADYENRLTAVISPDMKDWHDNAKSEWPEVAAAVITSLREQAEFFRQAFDRSDARVTELTKALAMIKEVVQNDLLPALHDPFWVMWVENALAAVESSDHQVTALAAEEGKP